MSVFPMDEPDTSDNDHDHGDETDMTDAFLQGDIDWSVLVWPRKWSCPRLNG